MDLNNIKIFSGSSNPKLAQSICDDLGVALGKIKLSRFKSGEIYCLYEEGVRNCDVFLVQTFSHPINEHLMELLVMMDAAKRASARTINLILPYYGYSRQERKAAPREPISAKLVADLVSAAGANRVITIDLHAPAIQGFFDIPVDHLTALDLISDYITKKNIVDPVIVSPDAGRATTAERLANILDAPFAMMFKKRPAHNEAVVTHVIGDVKGRTPIIIEDLIDTGTTIVNVVEGLKERGANDIYVCATHAVFSGPALQRLDHPNIREVVITDSLAIPDDHAERFKVLSVAPLLSHAVRIVSDGGSLSSLFKYGGV
ncbi:ribose-phosphate pyrophosphokinase [Paenibacillus chitinolyticus]|uniref:Ribose-phosphate pyrophosphokinase n=1 Tax=Paenibacillus chitinolyticus TaxID=79263 RepID=A0A410WQT8_9BACL|nr:ribose-phosphate pyrophosphokinase [Paenibacillus chitinolyticus]MCY9591616.1 ribose-phosphate pyrophosphokinase [Paenibacillus chitinolyticus]MCY9594551.1 ribose-phosphate pyrophosphokinase [Paenibacillus chitinolyticus]QAV16796.1 ribose-phosphate pyrophosphokinase [Paenibacillus chitinolyticus]GKS12069.1 ribose-phosphate pyrophosphokinase [Paenibacillus chitinolyticus]